MGCASSSLDLDAFRARYPATIGVLSDKEVVGPLKVFHGAADSKGDGSVPTIDVKEVLELVDAHDGVETSIFFPYLWNMPINEPIEVALKRTRPLRDNEFVRLVEMVCFPEALGLVKSLFNCMARHENQDGDRVLNTDDFALWGPWADFTMASDVDSVFREEVAKREPDDESGQQTFTLSRFMALYRRVPDIIGAIIELQDQFRQRFLGDIFWQHARERLRFHTLMAPQLPKKAAGPRLKARRQSGSKRYSMESMGRGRLLDGTSPQSYRKRGGKSHKLICPADPVVAAGSLA